MFFVISGNAFVVCRVRRGFRNTGLTRELTGPYPAMSQRQHETTKHAKVSFASSGWKLSLSKWLISSFGEDLVLFTHKNYVTAPV